MRPHDLVVLLQGRLSDLKPMRRRLRGAGIDAALLRAPNAAGT